ncbi:FG-GAP-like repeat-containing protein [Chitinophaga silvatica]|nr:FG-GAP-like repeat-containing protein [Chitinophaga silvatica]
MSYVNFRCIRLSLILLISCISISALAQNIDLSRPVGTSKGEGKVDNAGAATYKIPIKMLPGLHGLQPDINLVYNSRGGDGIAGIGWQLSCMSMITRGGKDNYYNGITAPIKFTNDDAFVLDGQRLFPITGDNGAPGTIYGLEDENFSKIESISGYETTGPDYFKVTLKNGTVMEYGRLETYGTIPPFNFPRTSSSKIGDGMTQQNMIWLLNRVTDIDGNYMRFRYTIDVAERTFVLSNIYYSGNSGIGTPNEVVFYYDVRNNWANNITYDAGASLCSKHYLTGIKIFNPTQMAAGYDLVYDTTRRGQYFLKSITEKGSDGTALNPITFTYGNNTTAPDIVTSIQYSGMHIGNVYAGDFDGNGKQDILSSNYYIDNNKIPHYTSYDVLSNFGVSTPSIEFFYNYPITDAGAVEVTGTSNASFSFLTNDYDGDTKEDVLLINSLISGADRIFNGIRINYSRYYSVYTGNNYQSVAYSSLPHSISYVQDFKYVYKNGTDFGSFFVPGDFDGDGAQDYILILGINNSNAFKAFFSSPKLNIFNQEIAQFGVEGTTSDPFYANSVASAKQLIPIDFDGDGKQEILVVKDNQSYVLSVFPVSITSGYNYAAQVLATVPAIKGKYPVFPGDFNGDGKTDLLYRNTEHDAYAGNWYVLTSTGKAYNSSWFGFLNRVFLPKDNGGSAHHLMVADLNGDGKSDIWHSMDLSGSTSKHVAYFSSGLNFRPGEVYNQNVSINGSEDGNTVVGDFNGDGKPDIFGVNSGAYGRFIYPRPFKEEKLLTTVYDGLGASTRFNYSLLNQTGSYNRTYEYEYDVNGTPIGNGQNGKPYNVMNIPMYVVTQSYKSNGSSSQFNFYHNYTNAVFHRIRGFLGFKKIASTDEIGLQTVTEMEVDPVFLVPRVKRQYTASLPDYVTDTKVTDTLMKASTSYSDKRFVRQQLKTLNLKGLTGEGTEITNTYDNYGNITQSIIKKGSITNDVITPIETTTVTAVIGTHGTPFPASIESATEKITRSGQPEFSKITNYTYDGRNRVTSKVEFASKPKAVTTNYTYDNNGNVTQKDVLAAGLTTRTEKYTYDATGRYLTKKETVGSDLPKIETYTYEPIFGNIASKVSSDGLTTTFTYDVFGRLATTTLPEGYVITQSLGWESTNGRYFVNVSRPGGGRNVKTYYDVINREVRKEESGFNNGTLISTKTYNWQGLEASSTEPYYGSETPVTTSSQYDYFGRLTQQSRGTNSLTYTYTKLAAGQFKVTATNAAAQSNSKTQDAAGKVVTATDNGGTLTFTYNSQGNVLQASLNGNLMTTTAYDEYGNQSSLADKNAGTNTYVYDAFKQLVSKTNPAGQTTTMTYDPFGRMVNRTGPEGATGFEYWKEAATGYVNDNITKISGFSGEVKEYTYDNLRRNTSEKVTVDGLAYTTQYGYDTYSNVAKTTYPSGIIITRVYDHDGTVTSVKLGEGSTASNLFTATGMNGLGKYTNYSYGNGKTTTETYDPVLGALTQSVTSGIQQMSFTFDQTTGNLTSRKDLIKNLEEVFTYDYLNRLSTTKVNNVQQLAITYDGGSGSSVGNIATKTDAGNYVYNNQKNNALAYITNPAGAQTPPSVISTQTQNLTYTGFQKAATVTEGTYALDYTYGSDYQRIKSVLKNNGAVAETRYYLGDYEKQVKPTTTKHLHYIQGGNGVCAVISLEGGTTTSLYTYQDYLGSILNVTDATGAVVASQNFDAWGRYRNPTNWTYTSVPLPPENIRGFTGHEHLKEFSLINMNGRIYDPIQARMMSPDNIVKEPFYSQMYNRYTYALNNPLKYSDPSGNILFELFLVGFIDGFFSSGSNRWQNALNGGVKRVETFHKILEGQIKGNFGQIFSRHTWESFQNGIGLLYALHQNAVKGDLNVEYFDGATVITSDHIFSGKTAVTMGSYIFGNSSKLKVDITNDIFMHEYGHYLQSQKSGPLFMYKYGLPSAFKVNDHDRFWVEMDANTRAYNYFSTKYNVTWNENENPRGEIRDFRWWEPFAFIIDPLSVIRFNIP